MKKNAIWRRLLVAKYGETLHGWASGHPEGSMGCGVWKNIFKGMDDFLPSIRFKINSGESVRFWHDPWCEREPLASLFPSYYNLVENKGRTVKEHMIRTKVFWSLNI